MGPLVSTSRCRPSNAPESDTGNAPPSYNRGAFGSRRVEGLSKQLKRAVDAAAGDVDNE